MPGVRVALLAGSFGLAVSGASAALATGLRLRGVGVAYTRKLFHFGVFTGAAAAHTLWGLPGTNAYGTVVAILVLAAVADGEGHPFYQALARESDRPRRSLFIVLPLATTALGGLASALLAGPHASVGYLVAGWGDAVGEPVGARWGRRPYRVLSVGGVSAVRTLEGSLGVFIASWGAATVGLWSLGVDGAPSLLAVSFACGVVAAAVEAASHHGIDNFTIQVAVSVVAAQLAS